MEIFAVLFHLLAGAPRMSSEIPSDHDILRASQLELEAQDGEDAAPVAGGLERLAGETGLPVELVRAYLALADCESGAWLDGGTHFAEGSASWTSTAGLFEGGLQFHPDTWDGFRDPWHPDNAADASRGVEIVVAERVRQAQGWGAWPVCSRKVGLR